MATRDIPVVTTIERRLRDLLDVAHQAKPKSTINPPLQPATFHKHVASIAHIEDTDQSPSAGVDGEDDATDDGAEHEDDDQPPTKKRRITPTPTSSAPHHAALETAARDIFYSLLATHAIDTPAFGAVWNLLDILQFSADAAQCDPSLPLWLIEELLDSQTIDGCRRVFDYLEARRETLISRGAGGTYNNKKMIMLRSCNELLRRLSRAEDAVFCGRVFVFLFGSFPLGDKSSVNLRGEFHTENTTVFDDVEVDHHSQETGDEMIKDNAGDEKDFADVGNADHMEVDTQAEGQEGEKLVATKPEQETNQAPGDEKQEDVQQAKGATTGEAEKSQHEEMNTDKLYTSFWSLQHVFSHPTKIFNQPDFDGFKKGLELTVKKFKSTPKVLQTHASPRAGTDTKRGLKRKRSRADNEFASTFNPKYLTSRDLFELEMSDLTFQRHILVQSLIMLDFLLAMTPRAKKRLAELKAQRALLYNFTLSEEDTTWATNTRAAIASYLQEGPDGKFYYRMADTVLARDKNWVRWKVESCPPISIAQTPTTDYIDARSGAQKVCGNRRIKANPMGAVEINFLSDDVNVNSLDKMRDPERYTAPDVEKYIRQVEGVDLDLEMAKDEEKEDLLETRLSATWRVLRLASKSRLNVFHKIDDEQGFKALRKLEGHREDVDENSDGTVDAKPEEAHDAVLKAETDPDEPAISTDAEGKDVTTSPGTPMLVIDAPPQEVDTVV